MGFSILIFYTKSRGFRSPALKFLHAKGAAHQLSATAPFLLFLINMLFQNRVDKKRGDQRRYSRHNDH